MAVFNAAPRATHARASLAETLKTMDAALVEGASVKVPVPSNRVHEASILPRELSDQGAIHYTSASLNGTE